MTEETTSPQADEHIDRRRMASFLALGIALLAVPVVLTRLVIATTGFSSYTYYEETRLHDMRRALPFIASTRGRTVLVLGSSLVEWGFKPDLFDSILRDAGKPVVSFNLGIPGLTTHHDLLFLTQTMHAFQKAGHRSSLTVLEFMLGTATKVIRKQWTPLSEQLVATLEEPPTLWHNALHDPPRALAPLVDRELFYGVNPGNLRYKFTDWTSKTPAWWPGTKPPPSARDDLQRALLKRPESDDWQPRRWSVARRGFPELLREDTAEGYAKYAAHAQTPEAFAEDLAYIEELSAPVELDFDDALIDDYIEMCKVAAQFSDRTVLMLSPERPQLSRLRTADALARRAAAIKKIEGGCGMKFIDIGAGFENQDFIDAVHVNQSTGMTHYTRALAQQLEPLL